MTKCMCSLPILIATLSLTSPSWADDETMNRLKQEAIESQRRYRSELLKCVSGMVHFENSTEGGTHGASDTSFAFSFPSEATEAITDAERSENESANPSMRRTSVVNPKYGFHLGRPNSDSSWVVSDIASGDLKDFRLKGKAATLKSLSQEALMIHRRIPVLDVEGVPVDVLLMEHGTAIRDANQTEDGRVRVIISGDIATPTGPDHILEGELFLLPNNSWAVDEYKLVLSTKVGKSTVHRKVTWTAIDDMEVPTTVKATYEADGSPLVLNSWFYTNWD